MIKPTQNDIGRAVIYQGGHPDDRDFGVITSFNDNFVFVRYGAKINSQATNPHDLSWQFPTSVEVLDLYEEEEQARYTEDVIRSERDQ